ncbi:o-succinylbenzoate synthase [Haloferax mediterranei ATCC 33500]|uniref:o-succinylbenzoate synthase n=1 Tax=Haloferax mediterranei (strain ATCC 33500 / DSM 1411 / JCM 8866 / NBRC 14739 / NCIMB 2177 / R-4) TaxID=523841 RepID=I3R4S3_HALMT|nr:o-succinylbenzoate synthase [Haloferax mediterranei]AFK19233.1 O-succinylbenzoate-CoA synthase (OSB synthase; 4-(2'-carboxyphenyl)-4-oxybutyric acid synthase) [Haloferax mediterranei ATCC 33500]AHZ21405.1 chloromuconate cycloisomerase [Haloferax mediterranei ATCC 33500]EMA03863.1 O-succinylbenzoate-CoA synthase [Haloferax mediterranei ATCC 33500]MDX5989334.1 o-succinylbenzoate synthase [Haloferax mediterranei ATCC 33500]QCQ75700.1 o-succinylbenzoate synthase [Haloferax mediterranei ATCC 335
MELQIREFSVDLRQPLSTAKGDIERREGFLVAVDAAGTTGIGEATPLPGWTESLAECGDALNSVSDPKRALADGSLADAPAARHAVSLALADARARAANQPLATTLDTDSHTSFPVNSTLGDAGLESTVEAAKTAVSQGYECLKVKVGARDPSEDADRLRAVRDAVGSGVSIRADANASWDRWTADRFLDAVADVDLEYLEQPLPATELDGHAVLRRLHDTPIALDESLATVSPKRAIASNAADVLVCKPMALGGPDRVRDVAARARDAGVGVVVTTTIDAVVARLGALHVAASLPDNRAHGLATASFLDGDLADDPAPVRDGTMRVPDAPGLGIDVTDVFD